MSIIEVVKGVADCYDLSLEQLLGKDRSKRISEARHAAMYLTRILGDLSYPQVGKIFNRDHSSVVYACKKVETMRDKDPKFHVKLFNMATKIQT